jgi:hypothetical protein
MPQPTGESKEEPAGPSRRCCRYFQTTLPFGILPAADATPGRTFRGQLLDVISLPVAALRSTELQAPISSAAVFPLFSSEQEAGDTGMNSTGLPTRSPARVIADICTKLADKRSGSGAAYAMIVGAGFSYGGVPLTKELLRERIGDFYYPAESEGRRSRKECRELSADYWKEFNVAASHAGEKPVEMDDAGLPANPSEAYQHLFSYRVANALFSPTTDFNAESLLDRLQRQRDAAVSCCGTPVYRGREIREGISTLRSRSGRLLLYGRPSERRRRLLHDWANYSERGAFLPRLAT